MPQIIVPQAVITADPQTAEVSCTYGLAIVVLGGSIVEVGNAGALIANNPTAEIRRFPHSLLTPGFVNGHHHVGLTPVQLGSPDSNLETWIAARVTDPQVEVGIDTTYSAIQMLRSGVTTVQHPQRGPSTTDSDRSDTGRRSIDAYLSLGMRASYASGVWDQNFFIHDDDEKLLPALPQQHRTRFSTMLETYKVPLDDQLAVFVDLREAYHDESLIAVQLSPANLHWTSDECLEKFGDLSASTGAPMHIHMLETIYQSKYMDRRAGADRVRYLAKSGVLGERLTLGHGTWLQSEEIEALAGYGASVCQNCSSNFRLSSGRMPIHDLLDAGVNLAMGIDEAGINDDRDMLQEMRLVYTTSREPGISRRKVTSEQVFTMATLGGARTTGFGDSIGTITTGAHADFVLFDQRTLRNPLQLDGVSEVELLVQRSRSEAITDIMIDGRWVMVDSIMTTVDESAFTAELVAAHAAINKPDHAAAREFTGALTAAVGTWFTQEYGI